MFDFIRNHQRLMQFLLALLIVPSFALFGLANYAGFGDQTAGIASIAGKAITQQEFDDAQREQMQRFGAGADPKMFNTPEARAQILDGLINQRVLLGEIARDRLGVSKQRVALALSEDPAIKALYKPDGTIDPKAYQTFLAAQGLTADGLFANQRTQILYQEVLTTIPNSAVVPKATAARLTAYLQQQRDVQELQIKPADFVAQVKLAPDAEQKYYDAHKKEFEVPEQVNISYAILSAQDLTAKAVVKPEDIQAFYDQNHNRYQVAEQRRASHILIAVPADASADVKAKAKAKADDLLLKVRVHPDDFAKLARENSEDPGSKEAGGDLEWAPASNYVPPFAEALNRLKENEISDVVTTSFGFHIIRLTGIRPASVKPLEQVKGEIEQELKRKAGQAQFPGAEDTFQNLVYEQASSLQPAAEKLGLAIQKAEGVTRTPNPKLPPSSPLNQQKLLDALFSDDVLKNQHNTPAVEAGPGQMIAAHVDVYKPAVERPFAEVSAEIHAKLMNGEAAKLAKAAGEAKLAELKKSDSDSGFGPIKSLSRSVPADLPQDAAQAILKADVTKLPAYVGLVLSTGSYGIYRVAKVEEGKPNPSLTVEAIAKQLATQEGTLDFSSYLAVVRKRDKVKIDPAFAAANPAKTDDAGAPSAGSSPSVAKP